MRAYKIAILDGDGIGPEIMQSALSALDRLESRYGFSTERIPIKGGAEHYRATGSDLEDGGIETARATDAILFAAMGLPDVRFPDGTEIAPHLTMRSEFGLFAGIRPVRRYPNTPSPLGSPDAENIDLIVLRESTEGLFASRGKGIVENDTRATDTMVITRPTCEKLFDFAIELTRMRQKNGRGKGRLTCVDKSNVFVSMAFFRKIFSERAMSAPDLTTDYAYVDAAALDLVKKPWTFDVMVMENMFGDILSDLCGGLVGGMGMAPCAEVGLDHALFQPAHGTAPDIAGTGRANPTAMLVSTAMMLEWLGMRYDDQALKSAATALDSAVYDAYSEGGMLPMEFGGPSGLEAVTQNVVNRL